MPLISIITVNYNNREGLEKTIHSVKSQSFQDFEYIVVDGASSDGSAELLKEHTDRINIGISERDSGVYNAMNKGIRVSSGDYLLFLNSGDFLVDNQVLENVLNYKLERDIVYGDMRIRWSENNLSLGKMPQTINSFHLYKDTIWHPVTFIKRDLLIACGLYNENYKLVADYDFFCKAMIQKNAASKYIPVCIAEYNTEGMSSREEYKKIEKAERQKVISSYLTPAEINEFELKLKREKNWKVRLKQIIRRVFK